MANSGTRTIGDNVEVVAYRHASSCGRILQPLTCIELHMPRSITTDYCELIRGGDGKFGEIERGSAIGLFLPLPIISFMSYKLPDLQLTLEGYVCDIYVTGSQKCYGRVERVVASDEEGFI
ncbi:unnamed protein product [Ilex paraguariensis]|uniref:Uncharacterized protein n=1 Tax=Ilex paraguariensis TaxID=185542 RepID=A0ABC8UQC0_9AQUA